MSRAACALALTVAVLAACKGESPATPATPPTCTVSSVAVTPSTASIAAGGTTTVSANINQQNCSGLTTNWSTANSAVATVSTTGTVTGVTAGVTTITATVNGVSGSAAITVTAPVLGSQWQVSQLRIAGAGDAPTGYSNAAWAATATDLFVASNGDLYRYTAGSWRRFSESGFGVSAMWGSSANDVWGVGQRILRWNGTAWSVVVASPAQPLNAVWGSSSTNVFAVGRGGTILRFDGSTWAPMTSPVTSDLVGISGSGASFALAVSNTGQVVRWDGANWTLQVTPASNFRAVWVASPTSAFAVGAAGVYRWDGNAWTSGALPEASSVVFNTVSGNSPTDVYAGGSEGYVAHFNGSAWARVPQATGTDVLSITSSGGATYGTGSGYVGTLAPAALTMLSYAPTLNAVWAPDANTAWAVGESGTIWRYSSGTWQRQATGTFHNLNAVWAGSASEAWAAGTRSTGAGVLLRFDGSTWSEVSIPASGTFGALHGPSGSRLVAMSRFSPLVVYDGNTWSAQPPTPAQTAAAIWGAAANDFMIVGTNGYSARYDGSATLTPIAGPAATAHLVTVWGSGANNYFAGTNNGVLYRFNGTAWTQVSTASGAAWRLWGAGPSSLYTLSFNGGVGHWDGTTWRSLRSANSDLLFYGFSGTSTRLFAVGTQGAAMVTP